MIRNTKVVWLIFAFLYVLFCVSLACGGTVDKTFNQAREDREKAKVTEELKVAAEIGQSVAASTKVHFDVDEVKWMTKMKCFLFVCSYQKHVWGVWIAPMILDDEKAIMTAFLQAEADVCWFWHVQKAEGFDVPDFD